MPIANRLAAQEDLFIDRAYRRLAELLEDATGLHNPKNANAAFALLVAICDSEEARGRVFRFDLLPPRFASELRRYHNSQRTGE